MFDIGFSELLLFGVIALIVLGPEKLPKAARTAGQWYAKLRRTISTLQSEIEAEFDLAETRQQMQDELAKIRQTEADMKRELAEMRGSLKDFEHSQNQSLNAKQQLATFDDPHNPHNPHNNQTANDPTRTEASKPTEFNYAYGQEGSHKQDEALTKPANLPVSNLPVSNLPTSDLHTNDQVNDSVDKSTTEVSTLAVPAIMTRPWENMWFRLGDYDKARRLPAPPYLPNYKADILLYTQASNNSLANKESDQ